MAQEPASNGEGVTGYRLDVDDGRGGPFDLAWHGTDRSYEARGLVVIIPPACSSCVLHGYTY